VSQAFSRKVAKVPRMIRSSRSATAGNGSLSFCFASCEIIERGMHRGAVVVSRRAVCGTRNMNAANFLLFRLPASAPGGPLERRRITGAGATRWNSKGRQLERDARAEFCRPVPRFNPDQLNRAQENASGSVPLPGRKPVLPKGCRNSNP
jgi:hypothetical protein